MTRLVLVRHGETEWNRLGRYQGQSDIALNARGLAQAENLGKRLASEKIDAVYCSDLRRAKQTIRPLILGNKNKVTYSKELRELNFGDFEGKYFEEIKDSYIPLAQSWRDGNLEVTAPGGETLAQLGQRITCFADQISEKHSNETVLVVAHGGPLQMMICYLIDIDIQYWWRFHLDTASLSVVDVRHEWNVLSLMNGTAHLRDCK